jgi:hypothetical protein
MRSYIRNGDQLHEPCGVTTGPKITVLSPSNNVYYNGPLPIHVYATSPQGIFRITFKVDGTLIRNYGDHSYPKTLSGYLQWQGAKHISPGKHTLTFLAYDEERNVSEANLTIFHGGSRAGSRHSAGSHHGVRRRRKSGRHRKHTPPHGHRARH